MLSTCISAQQSPLQIDKLRCEYLENPLGIDAKRPKFSWTFISAERNQFQSAYEIIVSDNKNRIEKQEGDLWTTGKIISGEHLHIPYGGKLLAPFTRYFWRVRVYNHEGKPSGWSKSGWFETAMLDSNDWKANWIDDGSVQPGRDEDYYKDDPMPLFRKEFTAQKKMVSARLYISGLGYYEAYLNGKKVGDQVLDPGFTTYRKQVLYSIHDVTSYLKNGRNAIGIMLGNGWYNPLPMRLFGRIDLRKYQQTGRPCIKAEIHIRFADGSFQKIITDESWLTANGPVLRNNVYLGEVYDAQLELPHWNEEKFDASAWKHARITPGPSGKLMAQLIPPIRITKIMKPTKVTEVGKDTFIVDMGQNFAGVARINITGKPGTRVKLRYGENIYKDGRLNYMTTVCTQLKKGVLKGGAGAPETAWQQDEYILSGKGKEVWNPRFTFHGFRFIEITGWPGRPGLEEIEGLRMNSDLNQVGEFECSNEMLSKLHKVIQWTFLSNVFSVQSDCPGREKMGYGADMVVTADAFLYNYDMAHFYGKAVQDFANEQQPDGGITEMAPYMGIADKGYGGESGPLGWELGYPYLQKKLYEYYGDKTIIEENYENFRKQIRFLQSKAIDGLFHWDIGDHEALDPKPEAFSAAAFYYHHMELAEYFAGLLGKKEDSIEFAKSSTRIRSAIIRKYFLPGTGRFDNGTQSAQLFALWYGFSPEPQKTFDELLKEFERHKWHPSSGIFGVKMMFDIFRQQDRNDLAYKIANQPDYPSWGYMLNNGATTLWESWAYPENFPSQNHPMFGSIDEWMFRSILGINSASPAFQKIIIKPQPVPGLTWARGNYNSISGMIRSDWQVSPEIFTLRLTIPPNTRAEVWIPSKAGSSLKEGGKLLSQVRHENGYAIVEIGSGNYAFQSSFSF